MRVVWQAVLLQSFGATGTCPCANLCLRHANLACAKVPDTDVSGHTPCGRHLSGGDTSRETLEPRLYEKLARWTDRGTTLRSEASVCATL